MSASASNPFRDTVPVLTGYLVIGMGYGILMKSTGFGIGWALAMSLFVYAGSMQFVAVGLLADGAGLLTVALTTLAVNARHLFYGVSMAERYHGVALPARAYLIYGLTDETYSLVCTGARDDRYCLCVTALDHLYWLAGTALGSLLGSALPIDTAGIDFALTALFLTVFTDQWLSSSDHRPALLGVGAAVLCLLIFGAGSFLIPAMLVITAGLLLNDRRSDHA